MKLTLKKLLRLFKKHGISAKVLDFMDGKDLLVFTATKTFIFSRDE